MCDHLEYSLFMPIQSYFLTCRMKDCIHPSPDHYQGEQPVLSRLRPVVILEVVETMMQLQMVLASYECLVPVATIPSPFLFLQPLAQPIEQVPKPATTHPLLPLSDALLSQPI